MKSRFKQLRQDAGLTQEKFRIQFNNKYHRNYTPSAISRFENDKRIPETMALIDFAEFFGVTVDYLLGHDTSMPSETTPSHSLGDSFHPMAKTSSPDIEEAMAWLKKYQQLRPNEKNLINGMIDIALQKTEDK